MDPKRSWSLGKENSGLWQVRHTLGEVRTSHVTRARFDAQSNDRELKDGLRIPPIVYFSPKVRGPTDILELFELSSTSHATDSRDKIFALYGIIHGAESLRETLLLTSFFISEMQK